MNQHLREAECCKRPEVYFHNAIKRYGADAFSFEIIDEAQNIDELNELEIKWINYYHSTDRTFGYNLDSGGKNCKKSQATLQKMRESTLQLWNSPEKADKMKQGLNAACEKWKSMKGQTYVTLKCECCGKNFTVAKYESKKRKFCSKECSNKATHMIGITAANIKKRNEHEYFQESIKNCIIKWCLENVDLVMSCPMNKVSTVYKPLFDEITKLYNIRDARAIISCVTGNYNFKEFAKTMKDMCNKR